MKLIISLGNPGKKYQNSRHNIGFIILDYLYDNWFKDNGFSKWSENKKFQAIISEGTLNNEKIILAKPTTFMNNSGIAAQALVSYYKTKPEDLYVIHDEIDLIFGNYKIQSHKSSAGHRGVQSIIQQLGTQDFTRVRIGIGKEDRKKQGDACKFVLKKFSLMEKLKFKELKARLLEEIRKAISTPL